MVAHCWSHDGSRLALATLSGHVYVLDRNGLPVVMLPPNAGPWHGRVVSALALPLFAVPLGAPPRILAGLKPTPLGGRAGHTSVRAAAFHATSATLVVAGDAARSGGEAAAGPTISVSAWRLEVSGSGSDCKAQLQGAYGGPLQMPGLGGAKGGSGPLLGRWSLAVSPLGEQAALCVPPSGGLLLLSLPQCSRVQLGQQALPGLSACAASAVSGCWWTSEAALALSDARGRVALAQLPGLEADLLLGPEGEGGAEEGGGAQRRGAQEHGVTFAPGSVIAAKVCGPGPRGLLVLEPVAAAADTAGGCAGRMYGGVPAGGGGAATSLRLLLLAERTAQEMMQLHVRNQRWAPALRLAAASGLDADAVYEARWAASAVDGSGEAVAANLECMRDRRWVVGECLSRLAVDAAGQRLLLRYGLAESEAQERAQAGDCGGKGPSGAAPWWWWRLARLRLLRHLDRLELLLAAQGGAYDAAAYAAFRDLPLPAAAGSWAALGGVGPLTALAAAYPAALSPAAPGPLLLGVLSRLPETLSPRLYGALLPRADNTDTAAPRPAPRAADWAEAPEQLAALAEALVEAAARQADGHFVDEAPGGGPLPGGLEADLTDATWRASLALLELGWERGGRSARLAQLLGAARALAEAAGLATALLGEEVQRRPGWAAALSEAEADAMEASASAGGSAAGLLFGGAEQMVKVLGRVQRSSASQSDAEWAALWRDLAAVRAAAFSCLMPEQVLSELCRCMLHCGRTDLANAYLRGGAPPVPLDGAAVVPSVRLADGAEPEQPTAAVVSLTDEAADALLASVAAELLAAADDPWDSSAQQAACCLALAGDICEAAQGLRRLMAALELLPDLGIELMPAQVMQMPDRFEVVRELAARSALRGGDVATAQHLALGLMAAQHTSVWSLCADLGSHKQLPGGDGVRRRLLSYAALHCPPTRMPLLLEELREVERRMEQTAGAAGAVHDTAATTEEESQLRQAITVTPLGDRRGIVPGGLSAAAGLPSFGDTLLALAVLQPMATARGAAADAEAQKRLQLLDRLPAAQQDESGRDTPHAQLQRVLALQCLCHCLAAAVAAGGRSTPQQRLQWLHRPLGELLKEVRPLSADGRAVVAAAAAAALAAESALAAARDSRAVRRAVPGVDAGQFAAGDVEYRREAILRQASAAGAAEAEALVGSGPGGSSPGSTSGPASPTSAASASRPSAPDLGLLRAAVSRAAAPLLASEPSASALLRQLATTAYPELPPTSGPHLAAWVALLIECLGAVAQLQPPSGLDAATVTALSAAACPALDKLRELLERAAGALKGLALTTLLAPLLAAVLQPLGLSLQPPAAAAAAGPPETSAAAAALFTYVKPANIAQAAKLVAALHKLLGPLGRKAPVPQLPPALDALPPSLPYLCLCVKAVSVKAPQRGGADGGAAALTPPQRDMAAAWGHIAEHVVRLPPPQLAAWLAFALLPGDGPGPGYWCPLPPAVTGCALLPVLMPRPTQTEVLDTCMPLLAVAEDSALGGLPGAELAVRLPQLRELHKRLRLLRAARRTESVAGGNALPQEQVQRLESDLFPPASGGNGDAAAADLADGGRVQSALSHLAAAGCPLAVMLTLAVAAAEGVSGASSGGAVAAAAVQDALQAALERVNGAAGPQGAGSADSLDQLRGVVRCLDVQPDVQPAAEAAAGGALASQLAALREEVWSDWGGNAASADASGDRSEQLRLRLLLTRTRALLAHLPPLHPALAASAADARADTGLAVSVRPEDLGSCSAAESLFARLLGAPEGGDGHSLLPAPQSRERLQLLSRLLTDVWQGGQAWEGQSSGQDSQNGAATGDHVSPLHGCWRALALAHLRSGQLLEVTRLLDPPPRTTAASPAVLLAEADVGELLRQAALGQATAAQQAPHGSCSAGAWSRWVLGLSSPYPAHRQRALAELQQQAAGLPAGSGSLPPAPTELEALLLMAGLARSGDVEVLLGANDARCLSALLLRHLLAAAHGGSDLGCPAIARAAVVPCLAALLVERGQAGLAAGLAARWLRLHPSLAAAGGSGVVLEMFLRKVAAAAGLDDAGAEGVRLSAEELGKGGWPGSVVWAAREREGMCRSALQQLAARAQQLPASTGAADTTGLE
eukprot:XP_001696740.1 predicted protein [Chlamydomonas reinhardtii]